MANRVKEDEKNERIIRGLLRLPENRRCINCNSLGPQYVCINFWTFVCTTCSGIHREFTHRVKSVSMAKFTSQEVTSLQEGGNQRAKEIYFKDLDPQRLSLPDSSNADRLRDFIKHVYVDRRYSGGNLEKQPRGRAGEKEDSYETSRTYSNQGGSRSPPFEDRRYSENSSSGGRSFNERRVPGFDQESRQYGDYKKSPARPEIINDWRREDRFGNGRRVDDQRISDAESKFEGRSPERGNYPDSSSPPVVRPVRDILGENSSPLRVIEPPPKTNVSRGPDGPVHAQRTASTSSLGSLSGSAVEAKVASPGSLIDFDAEPETVTPAIPQTQPTNAPQAATQPVNSNNDNNWASFDNIPEAPGAKISQAPSNVNTLESMLSQLSVSASVPSHIPGSQVTFGQGAGAPVRPTQVSLFAAGPPPGPASSFLPFPPSGEPAATPGLIPVMPVNGVNSPLQGPAPVQWSNMHPQQPLFPSPGVQSMAHTLVPSAGGNPNTQALNLPPVPNSQGSSIHPAAQAPQAVPNPVSEINSSVEGKSTGRRELPADLFTATYLSYHAPVQGWHSGPPRGMGFAMHPATIMPAQMLPQLPKSVNPFDVNSELSAVQASALPTMPSLQGAHPSGQPTSNLMRPSSFGPPSSGWMPAPSSSYASLVPSQLSYPPALPPGAYLGQQAPNVQLLRHPAPNNFVSEGAPYPYGNANLEKQMSSSFLPTASPNAFPPAGGNPFG